MALPSITMASTIDNVKQMLAAGDRAGAVALVDSIAATQPRAATSYVEIGECYEVLANDDAAATAYHTAVQRGNNESLLKLAEIATRQYRLDDADKYIAQYKQSLKKTTRGKGKQLSQPDQSATVEAQLTRVRTMLDRVEKIVVIDSLNVDANEFFSHYKLSAESGRLNGAKALPEGVNNAGTTVVYQTEDGNRLIWAARGADDNLALYSTDRLVGESWEQPTELGEHLGLGGNANYPFMMPDGVTLYYASDGEGSLGGYDIFISRRGEDGFLQPQNVGMPYNSPYNDYLLAIDEMTGIGWWASDRNHIDQMVTIYLFIPSDMRINVDIDDESLIDRARLTSIRSTWEPGADYSERLNALNSIAATKRDIKPQFVLPLPNGCTLTTLDDFKSASARQQMERYLETKQKFEQRNSRLSTLRQQYANGDTGVGQEILTIEGQQRLEPQTLANMINEIVKAETR